MIPRYTNPAMGRIWADQRRYETWLQVEVAAVDAMARAGRVARIGDRLLAHRLSAAIVDLLSRVLHDCKHCNEATARADSTAARRVATVSCPPTRYWTSTESFLR